MCCRGRRCDELPCLKKSVRGKDVVCVYLTGDLEAMANSAILIRDPFETTGRYPCMAKKPVR